MTWPLAHVNQILHWAENGHLRAAQVQQLEALAPLRPARAAWLAAGERLGLFGGAVLLALSVVFFFAYNWDDLHRFTKLALAVAALSGCVAAALCSRPGGIAWQSVLFGAALCTGALLALIGQIYQTGADIWELFAAWAVLMLPFVLLARAWPGWLLCLLVGNVCLARLWHTGGLRPFGLDDYALFLALTLGLNTLWWLAALRCGRWMLAQPGRQLERTAGFFALAVVTWGAALGVWDEKNFGLYIPLFVVMAGGALWWYRMARPDIVMLGIVGCCAVVLGASFLAHMLWGTDPFLGLLVMACFVLVTSGVLLAWLRDLYRQQNQEGA